MPENCCDNCDCGNNTDCGKSSETSNTPFVDFITKIKRIDNSLPLPEYHTQGSVGFDLSSREDVIIKPHTIALIPTNVVVEIPEHYMLSISLRSSSPRRKNLLHPAGIGVIDRDYCGDDDELRVQVYNFSDKEVHVERGERIAQAVFFRVGIAGWEEVEKMAQGNRGGFGSTGTH